MAKTQNTLYLLILLVSYINVIKRKTQPVKVAFLVLYSFSNCYCLINSREEKPAKYRLPLSKN